MSKLNDTILVAVAGTVVLVVVVVAGSVVVVVPRVVASDDPHQGPRLRLPPPLLPLLGGVVVGEHQLRVLVLAVEHLVAEDVRRGRVVIEQLYGLDEAVRGVGAGAGRGEGGRAADRQQQQRRGRHGDGWSWSGRCRQGQEYL